MIHTSTVVSQKLSNLKRFLILQNELNININI